MKYFDLTCIGNALIDVIITTDISDLNIRKMITGAMHLIDEDEFNLLNSSIYSDKIFCGGSAANTAIGAASFGAKVNFIGKVKNDNFGKMFSDGMKQEKVNFATKIAEMGPDTGISYISISPDNQERTMCTHLGAAVGLEIGDINEENTKNSKILLLEGYLWDVKSSRLAALKAIDIACKHGVKIAFTLSDALCIQRYQEDFQDLAFNKVDFLFGNKEEANALFKTNHINEAILAAQQKTKIAIFTLGRDGAIIITKEHIYPIKSRKSPQVIDTTGAGDLFAAGILYGLSHNFNLKDCGDLGLIASFENISHLGPRPKTKLKNFLPCQP